MPGCLLEKVRDTTLAVLFLLKHGKNCQFGLYEIVEITPNLGDPCYKFSGSSHDDTPIFL